MHIPFLAIGPESYMEWRSNKGEYESKKPQQDTEAPSPSSISVVGNSKEFNFRKKHSYPRKPTKKLGLNKR